MGREVFSRSTYTSARAAVGIGDIGTKGVTRAAEQKAKITGKLNPLVDPAGFGAIRLSLPRVEERTIDGKEYWELLVGTPVPIETRVDTTGSMGGNVDIAMDVLPNAFESFKDVLDGRDIQIATGIFGDVSDDFVLCRPQFEMEAIKIVEQLSLMVPERHGGDYIEDPDLGILGGAYFCRHYINNIGLKGYDFTVTDAPGRGIIDPAVVTRVFGEDAFSRMKTNGHKVNENSKIELIDVFADLLQRAHAFVIQIGRDRETNDFWSKHAGPDRVIKLLDIQYLPFVQAAIIGLTEGTLDLTKVPDFLKSRAASSNSSMTKSEINSITDSLSNIPIAAQMKLPNYNKIPVKGDLFDGKPDVWEDKHLWPVCHISDVEETTDEDESEEDDWK